MAIDQYGRPIARKSSDKLNNPSAFDPRGPKQEIVVVPPKAKAQVVEAASENSDTEYRTIAAPLPFYITGVTVFVAALAMGAYTFGKYLLLAGIGLAVYFISRKVCAPKKYEVQKKHKITLTGFAETDEILRKADNELRSIKKSAQHIVKKDAEFAGTLTELVDDAYKLVDFTSDNADQLSLLRRFYNYYLPTLEKLARTYVKLEKSGSDVEHVTQTKEEIISAADAMKTLFKKQFDKMYVNTALDISTDVDVLEAMLESDGIRKINEEAGKTEE
jgi:hypothetical protein